MLGQSKIAVILWVLAIALLPIRMANAHLHLCLDGKERPVAVHLQDVPTHYGIANTSSGHNDLDVDVSQMSVSAKKATNTDELSPAILSAYVIALVFPEPPHRTPRIELATPVVAFDFDLRPPTRGPPV